MDDIGGQHDRWNIALVHLDRDDQLAASPGVQVFDLHPFTLLGCFGYYGDQCITAFHPIFDRLDPLIPALDGS